MSKKTKIKEARKITTKAILKRLDNPIISSFGEELLISNPTSFKSLMWDMFGTKQGQKIIDKINDTHGSVTPPLIPFGEAMRIKSDMIPSTGEASEKEPITWEEFNDKLAYNSPVKAGIDYRSPRNDKLRNILDMHIANGTLDNLYARIEFVSPYFKDSAVVSIDGNILHNMNNIDEFKEVLYNKIYDTLDMIVEDLENYIYAAIDLPHHICDEFDQLIDVIRAGGCIDAIRSLTYDIYSIVALLLATETGAAISNLPEYKPKYHSHELRWVGASSVTIGVDKVVIENLNESDESVESMYRTDFVNCPEMTPELLKNLTDSFGAQIVEECSMDEVLSDFKPMVEEPNDEPMPEVKPKKRGKKAKAKEDVDETKSVVDAVTAPEAEATTDTETTDEDVVDVL